MCSLCGALGQGPSWEQEGRAGDGQDRGRLRRDAIDTAAALSRLLAPRRIRVVAGPAAGFQVRFPTGQSDLVASLSQVWHLLDQRRVVIPDPLSG